MAPSRSWPGICRCRVSTASSVCARARSITSSRSLRWYRDNGVKPQFALVPGLSDAKLGRELARLGYYQSGFHTAVICEPDLPLADDERGRHRDGGHRRRAGGVSGCARRRAGRFPTRRVSRPTCAAGSGNPAGRSIWPASMAGRRRPASSTSTIGSAIAPMPRPIPPSEGAGCRRPCCADASPTPGPPASTSSAAAPNISRPATATWSGWACACCSSGPCGAKGSE